MERVSEGQLGLRLWLLGLVGLWPASSQCLTGLGSSKALTENLPCRFRVTLGPRLDDREGPMPSPTLCATWDGFLGEQSCQ